MLTCVFLRSQWVSEKMQSRWQTRGKCLEWSEQQIAFVWSRRCLFPLPPRLQINTGESEPCKGNAGNPVVDDIKTALHIKGNGKCANFGMKKMIHLPRWCSGTDCACPHCLNTRRCTCRCPPASGRPGAETRSGSASEAWTWARSCPPGPVCACKTGCTPLPASSPSWSCTTQTRPRWPFRSRRAATPLRSRFLSQVGARHLQNKTKKKTMNEDTLSLSFNPKLWLVQYITRARSAKSQRDEQEEQRFPSSHAGQDVQVWVETGGVEVCWREVRTFHPDVGSLRCQKPQTFGSLCSA